MPQSRNRRPSKTGEPARKAPADDVTNNSKENVGNKDTCKIPRNIRYDLENALLGLCDVWFEEIKPHLVKNNLKVHTGGALNENGYSELEPAREPQRDGRAQLDPGAASDSRRRPAASSRAYSPKRPAASKAPCPKPPLRTCPTSPTNLRKLLQLPEDKKMRPPVQKVTARENSPPTLAKNYPRTVHESFKQWKQPPVQETPLQRSPAPRLTQTGKTCQRPVPNSSKGNTPQRGSSPLPKQIYQPNIRKSPKQKVPLQRPMPLAQTYHQNILHYPAERNSNYMLKNMRMPPPGPRPLMPSRSPSLSPIQFYPQNVPSHEKKNASSNRKKRKNASTHRTTPIPSSSVPPPKRVARPCCTACILAKVQTAPIAQQAPSKLPSNNRTANFSRWPALEPKCPHNFAPSFSPGSVVPPSLIAENPSSAQNSFHPPSRNSTYEHASTAISPSHFRKKSPFSLHDGARLLPSPLHAKCLAPPEHPIAPPRETRPVSTTLSPAPSIDETWFLRVFKEYTRSENHTKSPIREHTLPCHDIKSSRHTIPIHNENKLLLEDKSPLFSKDLVDLIGNKHDERLRVLYENPCRQESQPSVMCLAGSRSRKKRIKSTPKKMPWR